MNLLAIDPGTFMSAWVRMLNGAIQSYGFDQNETMLRKVQAHAGPGATVVCEEIESYGMPVGREVFATVRWCGRFQQAFLGQTDKSGAWIDLPRRAVKLELCNSPRAADPNVRRALLDLYGGHQQAIGCKASPVMP